MLLRSAPVQPVSQKSRTVAELPTVSAMRSKPITSLMSATSAADGSAEPDGSMSPPAVAPSRASSTEAPTRSVIGKDLTIIGQGLKIVSAGALQIDGQVHGDVQGADVIVGESGQVTGTVAGETVVVRGGVAGVIRGRQVTLEASSRVEGDIHHQALSILPGAEFDGRSRRTRSGESFDLGLTGSDGDQPKPGSLG